MDRTRKTSLTPPFLLKGLNKSINIGDHVFVLGCFYDISIEFWKCVESMVFFIFHLIVSNIQ